MNNSTYFRVIPRDIFNEANLLKCLGQLIIRAMDYPSLQIDHNGDPFSVTQDESDGAIHVENIDFRVDGRPLLIWRPLNSRESWGLWATFPDDPGFSAVKVFDSSGDLSTAFLELLNP